MISLLAALLVISPSQCLRQGLRRGRVAVEGSSEAAVVSDADVIAFMRDGHLFKSRLIDRSLVRRLLPLATEHVNKNLLSTLRHKVEVTLGRGDASKLSLSECQDLLAEVDPSFLPFLQLFNLWKALPAARDIACDARLGSVAARLLGVPGVRLYQDSLFVKRPGDGPTLWHTGETFVLLLCPEHGQT